MALFFILKNTLIKNCLIPGIVFLFTLSCNNGKSDPGNVAGGPCTFEDSKEPVAVYRIVQPNNSDKYDIIFRWVNNGNETKDSISYFEVNHKYVTAEQLKADSIVPGKICQFVYSKTVSGSCDSQKKISLEKY
jgi:hypothetical protein